MGEKILQIHHKKLQANIVVVWSSLPISSTDVPKRACVIYLADKVKADPLQAWSGPEGSRKLRFPDYMTTAQDGSKVVSLTHRSLLPPGNAPGTHFC